MKILLFSICVIFILMPTLSLAGKLMPQHHIDVIIKDNNLETDAINLSKYCKNRFSMDEIREALAYTYSEFPKSLKSKTVEFVQRAMDVAAAKQFPLNETVCELVSAVLGKSRNCNFRE